MTTIVNTIYKCDCCELESDTSSFDDGKNNGSCKVNISGYFAVNNKEYAPDRTDFKINDHICHNCATRLKEVYEEIKQPKKVPSNLFAIDENILGQLFTFVMTNDVGVQDADMSYVHECLNQIAQQQGYSDWIEAYHLLP